VLIVDLMRQKTDEDLVFWNQFWSDKWEGYRRAGEGFSGWWASKLLSHGIAEQRRRATERAESGPAKNAASPVASAAANSTRLLSRCQVAGGVPDESGSKVL